MVFKCAADLGEKGEAGEAGEAEPPPPPPKRDEDVGRAGG